MDKLKAIYASAYAACVSIVVTIILTVVVEFSPTFKTWLASFTGHHWLSKSWASIIIFAIFFIIFRVTSRTITPAQTKRALTTLEAFVILGFIGLLAFFIYEFLGG
ncbi:MAG TPA: hypothetical protein VI953_01035 [Candidatus Paceibacterota bacterium]